MENVVKEQTVEETLKSETLVFELPKEQTFEELQAELAKQEEIRQSLLAKLEVAKEKEKEQDFKTIHEILGEYQAKYGQDLVDELRKSFGFKQQFVVLEGDEIEDYQKFKHILDRGYYVKEGKCLNPKDNEISSTIIGYPNDLDKRFVMNVETYIKHYNRFINQ